jgi:hypothetical protein
MYLYVSYDVCNKQQLFSCTALTKWVFFCRDRSQWGRKWIFVYNLDGSQSTRDYARSIQHFNDALVKLSPCRKKSAGDFCKHIGNFSLQVGIWIIHMTDTSWCGWSIVFLYAYVLQVFFKLTLVCILHFSHLCYSTNCKIL